MAGRMEASLSRPPLVIIHCEVTGWQGGWSQLEQISTGYYTWSSERMAGRMEASWSRPPLVIIHGVVRGWLGGWRPAGADLLWLLYIVM